MALNITVKHKDGSETRTRITPATEVSFEAHFSKSWSEAFSEEHPRNTYIYYVTWHSIYDDGRTAQTFEEWLRTLESYEVEAEPADPSDPVALPG